MRWPSRAAVVALAASVSLVSGVPGAVGVGPSPSPAEAAASRWYMDGLGIRKAQRVTDGSGVRVCVIDDYLLPGATQLDHVRWGSPPPRGTAATPYHGTAMVTLIAADGGVGVAPGATIDLETSGESQNVLPDAVKRCADQGAKVISISLGDVLDPTAVAYAQARDVVIVGATGNGGKGPVSGPAGQFGVLSVAGTGRSLRGDELHGGGGSNWGGYVQKHPPGYSPAYDSQGVAVVGPSALVGFDTVHGVCEGMWIPLSRDAGMHEGCGTSDATAVVAGVVALVRAAHPYLNAANVINRVVRTARRSPAMKPGAPLPDPRWGFGIVDAYAAVTADVPLVKDNPLGSVWTGGRGVWDPSAQPVRPEPAAGVKLPEGDYVGMPLWDPGRKIWVDDMGLPVATASSSSVSDSASSSSSSSGSSSVAESSSGVPGWVWGVGAAGLVVTGLAAGILARRRRASRQE